MIPVKSIRSALWSTSALCALVILNPLVALAATTPAPAPELSEVVVTGTRASNQKAVAIKSKATQILDTVSASEIGQLPDFNAGDALKRVTGVSTLLYQGEPRFVIVRGFNQTYNDILVDGFSLASTDINQGTSVSNGRMISMEVLPSNLASHIDVVKSALPSNEGGFIGGLTNFVTPSAFDFAHTTVNASLKGGVALGKKDEGDNHFGGQAELAGATRFGSDDQFGLYVSATYWKRQINVPQAEYGGTRNWYDANGTRTATSYSGTGFSVPSQRLYYNYQNDRQRLGLQGRLDWHPGKVLSAYVSGYYFNQRENSDRRDLNAAVQTGAKVSNQTETTGTLNNISQTIQLGQYHWDRSVYGTYGRINADLDNGWRLDGGGSWSHSTVDNPQVVDAFTQNALAFKYDTSGSVPVFTAVNPTQAGDLTRYSSSLHREELYSLVEDRYDLQGNVSRNTGANDRGFGVQSGVRYSINRQSSALNRTNFTGLPYNLSSAVNGSLCGYLCDTPIPSIDANKVDGLFSQNRSTATTAIDVAALNGGTFKVHETVTAGYLQLQYRTDKFFVGGGARIEHTEFGSNSTKATNGIYAPVSATTSYTNVLPSLSVLFNTSDSSKLRVGASMSISRPGFGSAALRGGVMNTLSATPSLSTGNPNLKPREATNLDIGHDWYLDGGKGIVSIGAFHKWIDNDIFSYGTLETVPGVSVPVLVTEARNTTKQVLVNGLEFGFSHDLTFLPAPFDGFGLSANASFTRAHFPLILSDGSNRVLTNLPQQAGQIMNASIYYDKDKVHGRLAWNHLSKLWDDRYPNFTSAGFYANRYQQPTDNVDFQFSYDVTSKMSVSFDALNITHQGLRYNYGNVQELLQSTWRIPTQILVGVKVKL
jgi:TonB-dependent receptor